MNFNKETLAFLRGESISNGHKIKVDWQKLVSRNTLLVDLCKEKTVLHLGCADHIDLIEKKRKRGNYLHDLIQSSAKKIVGCDVNENALLKMRELGISDLYTPDNLPIQTYDTVIIPDVIEHIGDVKQFLLSIKKYDASEFVFTTPNAYRLINRKYWQHELINTDHHYWFSPYTLSKILIDANFDIKNIYYTDSFSLFTPIGNLLKFIFPLTRDGLLIVATKN